MNTKENVTIAWELFFNVLGCRITNEVIRQAALKIGTDKVIIKIDRDLLVLEKIFNSSNSSYLNEAVLHFIKLLITFKNDLDNKKDVKFEALQLMNALNESFFCITPSPIS